MFESKYRVVNVDLRGHWRSVAPELGYTPQEMATDVEALIENKFSGQKFVLVGHSMGGQIAAILGARRPDLVKAIVSVDGTLGVPAAAQPTYEKLDTDLKVGNPGDIIPPVFSGLYSAESERAIIRWPPPAHTKDAYPCLAAINWPAFPWSGSGCDGSQGRSAVPQLTHKSEI